MQEQDGREQFSFEQFAKQPFYLDVNHDFIDRTLDTRPNQEIVDMACGTGLVTKHIRDRFSGVPVRITGIDPNPASLQIAREAIPSIGQTIITFIEAYGQELLDHVKPESIDQIYFFNAIHEIPGNESKQLVLDTAAKSLRPGGKLFLNSTFTPESYPEDAAIYWGKWKLYAMKGLNGVRSKDPAAKFELLSLDEYSEMLEKAGLSMLKVQPKRVEFTRESLEAISNYDTFINGVFMDIVLPDQGIPPSDPESDIKLLKLKSEALLRALDRIEQDYKTKFGPEEALRLGRNWIEFEAQKPA